MSGGPDRGRGSPNLVENVLGPAAGHLSHTTREFAYGGFLTLYLPISPAKTQWVWGVPGFGRGGDIVLQHFFLYRLRSGKARRCWDQV